MSAPINPEEFYRRLSRRYDVIPSQERERWLRYCWRYDRERRVATEHQDRRSASRLSSISPKRDDNTD